MDDIGAEVANLHVQTQETRYQFLKMEFLTCFNALGFGNTALELGDWEFAEREVHLVERGYDTIRRFLPGLDSHERRNEMEGQLADLRRALDAFRSKLGLDSA
jgi:hypothetical protein